MVVTAPECTICSRTFKRFFGARKVALADLHLFLVIFSVTSLMVVNESWNCRAVSAKVRSKHVGTHFPIFSKGSMIILVYISPCLPWSKGGWIRYPKNFGGSYHQESLSMGNSNHKYESSKYSIKYSNIFQNIP